MPSYKKLRKAFLEHFNTSIAPDPMKFLDALAHLDTLATYRYDEREPCPFWNPQLSALKRARNKARKKDDQQRPLSRPTNIRQPYNTTNHKIYNNTQRNHEDRRH